MVKENLLREVNVDSAFFLSDGNKLLSLKDLRDALKDMENHMFLNYVNDEKNDFANWVKDVIGDKELADLIKDMKKEDLMFKAVFDRINELENQKVTKKSNENKENLVKQTAHEKLVVKDEKIIGGKNVEDKKKNKVEKKNQVVIEEGNIPERIKNEIKKRDYWSSIIDFGLGIAIGFALGLLVKILT